MVIQQAESFVKNEHPKRQMTGAKNLKTTKFEKGAKTPKPLLGL